MSAELFEVIEHVVPGQHIRQYLDGSADENAVLKLVVREYRPRNNPTPGPESITIIAAHGNSDPGQCYEPVWDDLLRASEHVKIRAIWMADYVNRGSSYVLNENILGDDPSAFDHSRDLLCMVNHFRHHMRAPIFGIGHSSGSGMITHLSILHPRLFHALAMVEPAFQSVPPQYSPYPLATSKRRDLWASREEAAQWFRRSSVLSSYESRMFDAYLDCMLRETPTAAYPAGTAPPGSVTLITPKAQEIFAFGRPNFSERLEGPLTRKDRLLFPGLSEVAIKYPFLGFESHQAYLELDDLYPGVLLLTGGKSWINTPKVCEKLVQKIGAGLLGSGGAALGMVTHVVVPDAEHILPQQKPRETAQAISEWLRVEMQRYEDELEILRQNKPDKSRRNASVISDALMRNLTQTIYQERPSKKLPKL